MPLPRQLSTGSRSRRRPPLDSASARLASAALALCCFVAAGCGGGEKSADAGPKKPSVVATIHPLAEVIRAIAGDRLEVVRLLPPGASPHSYEPRPSEATAAERALALFHVSDDLDGWAARLGSRERIAVLGFAPPDALLPLEEHHHHGDAAALDDGHDHGHDHDHAHGEGSVDPHFWLDPLLVRDVAPKIANALARLDPEGAASYRANAERLADEMESLHQEVGAIVKPLRGRSVLLFHPSFQYLLRRHGLRLAGSIEPFPGKEPSPKQLQRLARLIEEEKVGAVFREPQFPEGLAVSLVEAANLALAKRGAKERVALGELDPIGGVAGRDTYAELILFNARSLREALGGAPSSANAKPASSEAAEVVE